MTGCHVRRSQWIGRFFLTAIAVMALFTHWASPVEAQTKPAPSPRPAPRAPRPTPHAGTWEIGGGFWWSGGFDIGDRTAELTRNPDTGTGPLDLFTTSNTLGSGIGFQGRLGAYVSKSLAIEGGIRVTRPKLQISISGDFESAPDQVAEETITEYIFDGSVVWHLTQATFSKGKGVPFVSGGAGYIRDAHEANQLIETAPSTTRPAASGTGST